MCLKISADHPHYKVHDGASFPNGCGPCDRLVVRCLVVNWLPSTRNGKAVDSSQYQ